MAARFLHHKNCHPDNQYKSNYSITHTDLRSSSSFIIMPPESDHHTELTELRSRSRTKLDDASRSNNTRWPSPTTVIEERRNNNTESAGSASHHRTEKSASRESNANFLHRIRDALFPIHQHELPKFALLSVIDFFVIVVVTLTRDLKDTLVVTQCGAEVRIEVLFGMQIISSFFFKASCWTLLFCNNVPHMFLYLIIIHISICEYNDEHY